MNKENNCNDKMYEPNSRSLAGLLSDEPFFSNHLNI
jgi:hypothetical protein